MSFFIPPEQWENNIAPSFPFQYFRYQEFVDGIKNLSQGHDFHYHSYDWQTSRLATEPTIITATNTVIIEGVSVLNSELIDYYDKKIWVASDTETELDAIIARENNKSLDLWKNMYIPSVDIY